MSKSAPVFSGRSKNLGVITIIVIEGRDEYRWSVRVCMMMKHRNRKASIDKLKDYLLSKLNESEEKALRRSTLLNSYSYESGVSIRTLREYVRTLIGAGFITGYDPYWDPVLRLPDPS